jgi:6,7-dimethyl-8-ribityllumazine synthase
MTAKRSDTKEYRIALVGTRMHHEGTALFDAAIRACVKEKIPRKQIEIHTIPGVIELPILLATLAGSGKYDALVALGTMPLNDQHARMLLDAALRVMLDYGVPLGWGITSRDHEREALRAVRAALHAARLITSLKEPLRSERLGFGKASR